LSSRTSSLLRALKVTPKEINLGRRFSDQLLRHLVSALPLREWFSPIINMDKVFDVSIFVHPIETAKVLRQFQKKVAEVQSQIQFPGGEGLVRDPMLDVAYQDLENLRDQLQQAQEKLFDVGLYITIYATQRNSTRQRVRSSPSSRPSSYM
jgi:hypothetical protein